MQSAGRATADDGAQQHPGPLAVRIVTQFVDLDTLVGLTGLGQSWKSRDLAGVRVDHALGARGAFTYPTRRCDLPCVAIWATTSAGTSCAN